MGGIPLGRGIRDGVIAVLWEESHDAGHRDEPGAAIEVRYQLTRLPHGDAQVAEDVPAATGSRVVDHATWRKACRCGGPGVTHMRAGTVHS